MEKKIKAVKKKKLLTKPKILSIKLKDGIVKCELFQDIAPAHVNRICALAESLEYNNVVFHRVIDGFMAQTGDVKYGNIESGFNPAKTGTGGSKNENLQAEFSDIPFDRGILGMARSSHPDSANSQFFIMLDDGHHLNEQYTAFGKVTKGMKYVDNIKKGDASQNGLVEEPDKMISVKSK